MEMLKLSVGEPFSSPAFNSNFVVFSDLSCPYIPEEQTRKYLAACCRYARQYHIHLVPHRFVLQNFLCMCLISPDGRVLGAQRACYVNLLDDTDFERGTDISSLDTVFGPLFLCVDVDIYHPLVCEAASRLGAKIIISSQFIRLQQYGSHMVINGAWNVAQTNHVFVVSVTNHASAVCIPAAISQEKDGFFVPPSGKFPFTAALDISQLNTVRSKPFLGNTLLHVHMEQLLE
ncbi:hypothetical protein U6B65_04170 [Oscillospiraceae bacterium MB08-C2-2]|nr:hypothetical protein U6B65_04170 [Oscillospiraceae bacterium MB08-C2-2]